MISDLSIAPDWYAALLARITPLLSNEEHIEMTLFHDFFAEKIMRFRRIKGKGIRRNTDKLVELLREKVLWSEEHNGLFLRRISCIL